MFFRREAVKQQLLGETETREKSKKGTLLCAKSQKKKKKKIPYSSAFNDGKKSDKTMVLLVPVSTIHIFTQFHCDFYYMFQLLKIGYWIVILMVFIGFIRTCQ